MDLQPREHTAQVNVQLTENGILDVEAGFLREIWTRMMRPIYLEEGSRGLLSFQMPAIA